MHRVTVDGYERVTHDDAKGLRAYLSEPDSALPVDAEVQVSFMGDYMVVAIAGDTDRWLTDRGILMLRVYPTGRTATPRHAEIGE